MVVLNFPVESWVKERLQTICLPTETHIAATKAKPTWSFATATSNRRRCNFSLPTPAMRR